ncbi:MAG TPA: hypothetical protein VKD72_04415 [Gemmataceae bacterium]|nr:hypothetical protein [Gemmataceae bacterium]
MDQEPDLIKEQMAETRVSLTDKIEKLEDTLKETVQGTLHTATDTVENVSEKVEHTVETVKDAVEGSVEAVKETVHETVETVKEAFNLRRHVQRYPWAMLGGAIAVGFLGGRLLGQAQRSRERRRHEREEYPFTRPGTAEAHAPMPASAPAREREPEPEEEKPSVLERIGESFGDELSKLKGLALGATFGVLRDMLTAAVPEQMKPQLTDVMNSFTTKLGGKVIQGPLLDTQHNGEHEREGQEGYWYEPETGRPATATSRG